MEFILVYKNYLGFFLEEWVFVIVLTFVVRGGRVVRLEDEL